VDAGRLVTAESLIDRIWDDAPVGARRTRRTRVRWYVLQLDAEQVDVPRFGRLAEGARRVGGTDRMELLRTALAGWQG
jgi:hypothetical protein